MMAATVPEDLATFLREGRQLEYDGSECEAGRIELLPLTCLSVGEIWMQPCSKHDPRGDPHAGEAGYYAIPAVDLVARAEGYPPEFILLWLPEDRMYGTWDLDHWVLLVFPAVSWTGIVANPVPYLQAQWEAEVGKPFVPYPTHSFRPGWPF